MVKVFRYALYELKIFFRVKVAVFYSILFPVVLLLMYYAANLQDNTYSQVNDYFPYLISITLISTTAGLASLIVNNRVYNTWKFYNLYGYKTSMMTVATGMVYFGLCIVICFLMTIMMFFVLSTMKFELYKLLLYIGAVGLGAVLYIQIAIITGLLVKDPRNAQTIINGLLYIFVILSGSIIRFSPENFLGKVFLVFPNIHIGNLLHSIWNYSEVNEKSLLIVLFYMVAFAIVICGILKKQEKIMLYK